VSSLNLSHVYTNVCTIVMFRIQWNVDASNATGKELNSSSSWELVKCFGSCLGVILSLMLTTGFFSISHSSSRKSQ